MFKTVKKRPALFIVAAILIAIMFSLLWLTLQPNPAASYQTASVTRGNLLVTVSASGSIISGGITNVTTQASGTITHVYVKDGQSVNAGDKLADMQLDSQGIQNRDQLWSKYLAAKNTIDSAKAKQYALQAQMIADNQAFMNGAVASRLPSINPTFVQQNAQWLSSEAQYKNQQAVIQQAEVDVAIIFRDYQNAAGVITAGTSGTVVGLKVIPGMAIAGSTGTGAVSINIASIQSAKQVYGQFQVSEMDMSKVRVGQKTLLFVPAVPAKIFSGSISAIDVTGIVKSGVIHFPVTISIDNPTPELLTNMSADVKIILTRKDNILLVPIAAVQNNNGKTSVKVVKNGVASDVPVKIGLSNDTQSEILSGISENDVIVTSTQNNLQPSNSSTSPFSGLANPAGLAAPGGGNN